MAPRIISAHAVKIKFPEFYEIDSSTIEMAIEEAALEVDDTWGDYQKIGTLYYTAHILMVQRVTNATATGQGIVSESYPGIVSVTYKNDLQPGDVSIKDLESTSYGLRVLDFMSRLFPAVAVI